MKVTERQSSIVGSPAHQNTESNMQHSGNRVARVQGAFIKAASGREYKKALRLARQLSNEDAHHVIDALLEAAKRLNVQRTTGDPVLEGKSQCRDGSIAITWSTKTRRADGTTVKTTSTAVIEPVEFGPGWRVRGAIPESIVNAVIEAELNQ
jgi:hypothetical protein